MAARAPARTVTIRWSLIRNLILLILFLTGSILLTTVYTGRRIAELTSRALIDRALDRTESATCGASSTPYSAACWSRGG